MIFLNKKRNFEVKFGKFGLICLLIGISVLLITVFLLGIEIGKEIDCYPNKIMHFIPWYYKKYKKEEFFEKNIINQNTNKIYNCEHLQLNLYDFLIANKKSTIN